MSSPAHAQPSISSIPSQCVVICGEAGSGKSSLINLIAGTNIAVTSCDAGGCTAETNMYENLMIQNETLKVKLVDTAGLDEGPRGTVPDTEARRILKKLLRTLTEQGDIHLIMYCVRGEREIRTLRRNYELIRSQVKRKVPIVLVVTCLESYQPDMEDWWRVNERTISNLGMTFAGHACITTATMTGPVFAERRAQSYDAVCKLIEQCRPSNNTRVDTGSSLGTVHHVPSRETASSDKHPNVVIFGQAGAGKSSLVNLLAGKNVAETSGDLTCCTLKWKEYFVELNDGSYNIFDTGGLQEPQPPTSSQYICAVENARSLIQKLERQGGIDLLIFCMRAGRFAAALRSNYRLFNEFLCEKKVPVVMVITRLENEVGEMDNWWKRNQDTFRHQRFDVDGHACITAIPGNCPERYEQSRTTIRKLVKEFTAGEQKQVRRGDDVFVSLMQKLKLLLENSRSKDIVHHLTERCGLPPDVAKQLADMIKKDVVEGAT
ncbi:P-loop containing nucleoside triphosphate hydrolase protein [Suillus plorans]|uniref:P-loop containing nucleoside triphosphate hydrolase protein n=1 Tax=Suillus plorans TaxID=116603 RepID=A0A9P7APA7_9AGAM|nr:P-loop containing nucleoside triphosphate hydrolase protein [Suillus plorans]KAG1793486.1 P-loop containing nucleoside triphosphate hydrolase protein [Suillus plorans]